MGDMEKWQPFYRGYAAFGDQVVSWVDRSHPLLVNHKGRSPRFAVAICDKGTEHLCICGCGNLALWVRLGQRAEETDDEAEAHQWFLDMQEKIREIIR